MAPQAGPSERTSLNSQVNFDPAGWYGFAPVEHWRIPGRCDLVRNECAIRIPGRGGGVNSKGAGYFLSVDVDSGVLGIPRRLEDVILVYGAGPDPDHLVLTDMHDGPGEVIDRGEGGPVVPDHVERHSKVAGAKECIRCITVDAKQQPAATGCRRPIKGPLLTGGPVESGEFWCIERVQWGGG